MFVHVFRRNILPGITREHKGRYSGCWNFDYRLSDKIIYQVCNIRVMAEDHQGILSCRRNPLQNPESDLLKTHREFH